MEKEAIGLTFDREMVGHWEPGKNWGDRVKVIPLVASKFIPHLVYVDYEALPLFKLPIISDLASETYNR